MQKKEWQRNIFIGCIVAAMFFGWWLRGFLLNWNFHLFVRKDWAHVAKQFEKGWEPSSTSDWIFLLTILLAMPTFLFLWYVCARIKWRKLFKAIWKGILRLIKKTKKVITSLYRKIFKKGKTSQTTVLAPPLPPALPEKKENATARPKPIAHSGNMTNFFQNTAAAQPRQEARPTFKEQTYSTFPSQMPASGAPTAASPNDNPWNIKDIPGFEDQPLDEIQLPQREPVVEDIPALFTNAGYSLIENVTVSGFALNFVAVCADKIYAVLMDRESGDWLAEEEPFNGEAPLWFSEVDHRVSPVYELKKCAEDLQKKVASQFPNTPVIPFMIEEKGNIINAEEMMRIWKELNVVVSRTDIGGLEDLPTTTEVISPVTPASVADVENLTKLIKGENNG